MSTYTDILTRKPMNLAIATTTNHELKLIDQISLNLVQMTACCTSERQVSAGAM